MKKTKIIATVGPNTSKKEVMKQMILSGVDVFRINLSHASHAFTQTVVKTIRTLNKELNTSIGILIDTKGPEIRIGEVPNDCVEVKTDDVITLCNEGDCDSNIHITYRNLHEIIEIDSKILVDDGSVMLNVIDIEGCNIICKVLNDGNIRSHKSVKIKDLDFDIDFLSTDDKNDINFISSLEADFIALSFVKTSNDVLDVNDMLIGLKNEHTQIIAKIENRSSIEDIESIINVSDGIMIARGDLGIELDLEELPSIQKRLVKQAYLKNKICIVATEMLSSMEEKPRPTRAEISDVANAVLDGVDAVMLSGETAIGKYPIETIETTSRIINATEKSIDYDSLLQMHSSTRGEDITSVIAYGVVDAANMLNAKTIVAATLSGYTARKISSFRPSCPILATTPDKKIGTSLSLNWGVIPVIVDMIKSTDEIVKIAVRISKNKFKLEKEDKIVITGGFPLKKTRNTNFMKIEEIE